MLGMLKGFFGPGGTGTASKPGRRVNVQRRFTIVSEKSHGSMSRVYRAIDKETGQTVCLKIQAREKNEAATARASAREPRPPEGEMAYHLSHPHIVRTLDYGTSTQGEHFLIMEFIDGQSLQAIREARTARTVQKVEWLAQAAEGLAALHAAGFIHHDINPQNFLVNRDQQVKLIDFGLAVPNTPAFRKPGNRTGTLDYMAPELVLREPIDERIDVFAFGVMAFEFLTDRLPYDATNPTNMARQRINTEALDASVVKPVLSPEICGILRQLMARRKEDRWPTMKTLPDALRSVPAKRRRP